MTLLTPFNTLFYEKVKLVTMHHSKTPQDIKHKFFFSDLLSHDGNTPGNWLLLLECQRTWNPTIKQLERVEWMVLMLSIIIIFHCAYHLCHCDATIRAFVKNKIKCLACGNSF